MSLKLSEAIRLGAMLKRQSFTATLTVDSSCAWGAALDASGNAAIDEDGAGMVARYQREFPVIKLRQKCPSCGGWGGFGKADELYMPLVDVIAHLNDDHHWTRERIADWVATIEPQDAQPTHEVTHEVLDQPAHTHHD